MSDTLNIQLDYPMMTEKASVSVLTGPNMSLPMGHVTESEWKTASIRDYRMPPHSFTVIRIKSKHARNTSLHVDNLNDGRFSLDLSDNSYTLKPLFQ